MSETPARTLAEQAQVLSEQVQDLAVSTTRLANRTTRAERVTAIVVIGLILDIILSVAVGFALLGQVQTNTALQAAVDREAQTRQVALCPVYGLVLGGYNPNSRAAGPDRDAYIASFKVMTKAYESLDCTGALVPGPTR